MPEPMPPHRPDWPHAPKHLIEAVEKFGFPDVCTASGQPVWYLHPERTLVVEEDLRDQCHRTGRYTGAVRWSVLEHSALTVLLARKHLDFFVRLLSQGQRTLPSICYMAPEVFEVEFLRRVAVHDLHEYVCLDVPGPMKKLLPGYRERIENPWADHVHAAWGIPYPARDSEWGRLVKLVDKRALWVEEVYLGHGFADHSRGRLIESGLPYDQKDERAMEMVGVAAEIGGAWALWENFVGPALRGAVSELP